MKPAILHRMVRLTYRTRAIISRGLYIITTFFTAVYNQERLILETIYVVNREILQKLKYHTCAIITRGLYIFYPIFHCGL